MKQVILLLLVAALSGCGPSEAPSQADVPTVNRLASLLDRPPIRMRDLMAGTM